MSIQGLSSADYSAQQASAQQESLLQQLQDAINSDNDKLIQRLGAQLGLSPTDISSLQKDACLVQAAPKTEQAATSQLNSDMSQLEALLQQPLSQQNPTQIWDMQAQVAWDQLSLSNDKQDVSNAQQDIQNILGSIK